MPPSVQVPAAMPDTSSSIGPSAVTAHAAVRARDDVSGASVAGVREVSVVVSDPWSFVDDQGPNVFTAHVLGTDGDLIVAGVGWMALRRKSQS